MRFKFLRLFRWFRNQDSITQVVFWVVLLAYLYAMIYLIVERLYS